jgi:acyl carrier protein
MTKDSSDIENYINAWLKEELEQEVDSEANFAALGMDSLDAVRLTDDLAEFMGIEELPVTLILDHPTTSELAAHLSRLRAQDVA